MAWRLHLTNQAVQQVDIIEKLLAAWSRKDQVIFYDLATGTIRKEQTLTIPPTEDRRSDGWQLFMEQLKAPDGTYLPTAHSAKTTIYFSHDGRMRLYHQEAIKLTLEIAGRETALDSKDASYFAALDFNRKTGLIAAIDRSGKLFIYQQQLLTGQHDPGLNMSIDLRPDVVIAQETGTIIITDGQQIISMQTDGKILKRQPIYYFIRMVACSPNGKYIATSDMETDVVRVYNGDNLALVYQRFAVDLIAEATQIQLLADLPPASVALSDLSINNDGVIAFSMSGVICVSDLSHMDEISRRVI